NRRLRHSALTQQYHLDALALRRGNLPPQRSPQPPHLGFAAFDHLFPRIRWRSESHLGQQKQPAVPAAYLKNPPIQAVMEVVLVTKGWVTAQQGDTDRLTLKAQEA